MCLLTGVVHGLNWLGIRMKEMKEKMVASPCWLATGPATTYCLFELLGCRQAYTMFPELHVVSVRSLDLVLHFNGVGHRLGLHQEGPVGIDRKAHV